MSRRDEPGISTGIVLYVKSILMMIALFWSILHINPLFCHNTMKPGANNVISMVLQPGLAATTPSISTVMSSQHWSQWLNREVTSSELHEIT